MMTPRAQSLACLGLLACLVLGCSESGNQSYQVVTLPSGKQIKVLGVGKIHFTESDPALMLKYQTDLSLDNKVAIQQEVEEIWQSFKVDVEKAGLKAAIINANEVPNGMVIKTGRGYNFVYKKTEDRSWSRISN